MKKLSKLSKRALAFIVSMALLVTPLCMQGAFALPADEEIDYMKIRNLEGPSGVALGGIGVGYYEIDPTGKVTRNCINNVHKSFADAPKGCLVAVHDGTKATRLQRGTDTVYGMHGYNDSVYTGLWPYMNIDFENSLNGTANMGFSAYSGLSAHNVKDSAMPVVYYEVTLKNTTSSAKTMSSLLTFGDVIGRGMRDSSVEKPSDLNGESADWYDMSNPQTYAKGVTVSNGGTTYAGVMQYAKGQILPKRATFQNYNNSFMILAEQGSGNEVTILKNFDVNNNAALGTYLSTGKLNGFDTNEVALSAPSNNSRATTNGSGVAVSATVPANSEKKVKFMVSWFMPQISDAQYANMHRFSTCDFNKYYHNYFSNHEQLVSYAISIRDAQRNGISEWQNPILNSTMPDWMQFKQINSGYTLYSCGVLNKKGNFSTLEGEMGGYGGTMDQKMSSYAVYEKLFPSLNLAENRQFANVTGANGEIQHFDVHYYYGMSDYDSKDNPTPAGSMIDNTGAWMMQMWNHYRQTGSDTYLKQYYNTMKTSMAFLKTRYPSGTHIPSYFTTFDDYSHPEIIIFSGVVWMYMLEMAEDWANLMNEPAIAAEYKAEHDLVAADVEVYYGDWSADLGYDAYYAFGSDGAFVSSKGASGAAQTSIMFSGAMAGQFMSRMTGNGDILPFNQFATHMKTFIQTSIQESRDYYAPKVYNLRAKQGLDSKDSGCWPFYLESYGGMAAIQAGYLEDGLEVLEHTTLVDLRLGYTWTRSLWRRAYITYMTAPVSWMLGDILAGASVDAPAHTLTLGPSCIASEGVGVGNKLSVPLYYPKYWATLNYDTTTGKMTYEITKTFYESGDTPITIDKVIASPAGVSTDLAKTINLDSTFTVTQGAVLDLSSKMADFKGVTKEKLLSPVEQYEPPQAEVIANGSGLTQKVFVNNQEVETTKVTSVNLKYNATKLPADNVDGEYMLQLEGRIMPKYSQKYQLLFEYTGGEGDLLISFENKMVTDYSTSKSDVESQQFTQTAGCNLKVFTRTLEAGKLYPIKIVYRGNVADAGDDILRFLWWSTTQQMGLVVKERMYPTLQCNDMISAFDYTETTCKAEDDHLAYTTYNSFASYTGINFGSGGKYYLFKIHAAAIKNAYSQGGTLEIRRDSKEGELIGTLNFTPTSDSNWNTYVWAQTVLSSVQGFSGLIDIYLIFKPTVSENGFLMNYDKFTFEETGKTGTVVSATSNIDGRNYASATAEIEGDHMAWTRADSYALYSGIDFGDFARNYVFKINAAAINNEVSKGGKMEFRLDGPTGELLGTMDFTPTGAWDNYQQQSLKLNKSLSGVKDICLVFKPVSDFLFNYTTFTFGYVTGDSEPVKDATSTIDGRNFTDATAKIENETHMAWTNYNTYALYSNLDFGQTAKKFVFKINAGAIDNQYSQGGIMELRLDGPTGEVIGTMDFAPTGAWDKYEEKTLVTKKEISGVQDICLVFKPFSDYLFNYTTFTFAPVTLYGDTNLDGDITSVDALYTLQHSVSKITLTGEALAVADVDNVSGVTASDALNILQKAVELIDKFPVEA